MANINSSKIWDIKIWYSSESYNSLNLYDHIYTWAYDKGYDVACILHDKDMKEDGTPESSHYHVSFRCPNARSLSSLIKEFPILKGHESDITFKNDWKETVKYLTHESKNALTEERKYKYDHNLIRSNFDIEPLYKDSQTKENDEIKDVGRILDYIYKGHTKLSQILDYAVKEGLYGAYRRGYSIFRDVINEIKEEELQERNYRKAIRDSIEQTIRHYSLERFELGVIRYCQRNGITQKEFYEKMQF